MHTRRGAADEKILSALDRVELAGLGVQLVPVVDEKTLRCTQELLPFEFKAPLNSATAAWSRVWTTAQQTGSKGLIRAMQAVNRSKGMKA